MVHSFFNARAHRLVFFASLALLSAGLRAQLTVTLTGSMHNGSGVPCFGMHEGNVQSTVTGGTAPYVYSWSNGKSTPSIADVAAGYYELKVADAAGAVVLAQITLTEPEPLTVTATPHKYANGFNISCYECYNGSIDVEVEQGTPPYAYTWDDASVTTQDRTALGANRYTVLVTDANGCEEKADVTVTQPERSDWTMSGNANTNPATQYIGTSDNKDVVFKANGQESIRLKANGDISLMGSLVGEGPLVRDANGKIRLGGDANLPVLQPNQCRNGNSYPYWNSTGNAFMAPCPDFQPKLGTLNEQALDIITNGTTRMVVSATGRVGVGTGTPSSLFTVSSSNMRTGVDLVNTQSTNASSEIRFMNGNQQRWGLGSDFSMNGGQDFYIWDNLASHDDPSEPLGKIRLRIDAEGRLIIGDYPAPTGYRLVVQEGILTEKVKIALHTSSDWSDHVFAAGYDLTPLSEVSKFIAANGHLPGVPSAAQMVERGLDVARTDAMLMEKIEELTLYILQLKERIEQLEHSKGER